MDNIYNGNPSNLLLDNVDSTDSCVDNDIENTSQDQSTSFINDESYSLIIIENEERSTDECGADTYEIDDSSQIFLIYNENDSNFQDNFLIEENLGNSQDASEHNKNNEDSVYLFLINDQENNSEDLSVHNENDDSAEDSFVSDESDESDESADHSSTTYDCSGQSSITMENQDSSVDSFSMNDYNATSAPNLALLPKNVLYNIFSNLSYKEIEKNREVCRKFNKIGNSMLHMGLLKLYNETRKIIHKKLSATEAEKLTYLRRGQFEILHGIKNFIKTSHFIYGLRFDEYLYRIVPGRMLDDISRALGQIDTSEYPYQLYNMLKSLHFRAPVNRNNTFKYSLSPTRKRQMENTEPELMIKQAKLELEENEKSQKVAELEAEKLQKEVREYEKIKQEIKLRDIFTLNEELDLIKKKDELHETLVNTSIQKCGDLQEEVHLESCSKHNEAMLCPDCKSLKNEQYPLY